MSTNDPAFPFPPADRFCAALRKAVSELGGEEVFFDKIDNVEALGRFTDEFAKDERPLRSVLAQCLSDLTFRAKIIAAASSPAAREYLAGFMNSWDIWAELEPHNVQWVVLSLAGAPLDQLRDAIPARANDIFRCTSTLKIDSLSEELHVTSAIQLLYPNKELGGDGVLVMSATLTSYIESTYLMLRSLVLTKSEANLFNFSNDKQMSMRIQKELDRLTSVVGRLKDQFSQKA